MMTVNTDELLALPTAEKLRLIELLWEELDKEPAPLPLPPSVAEEVVRRRNEMRDPGFGMSHKEVWDRIDQRNG